MGTGRRKDRRGSDGDVKIGAWFAGRLPDDWFVEPPEVTADRDEILVIGALAPPDLGETDREAVDAAAVARIEGFREDTRAHRIRIADEAQRRFGRTVSWGARCGETTRSFTTLSVPAMTRLRMSQRKVLDTLVDAGVARSRSHALAWCVALVAERQEEWLGELREALTQVERVRAEGPTD